MRIEMNKFFKFGDRVKVIDTGLVYSTNTLFIDYLRERKVPTNKWVYNYTPRIGQEFHIDYIMDFNDDDRIHKMFFNPGCSVAFISNDKKSVIIGVNGLELVSKSSESDTQEKKKIDSKINYYDLRIHMEKDNLKRIEKLYKMILNKVKCWYRILNKVEKISREDKKQIVSNPKIWFFDKSKDDSFKMSDEFKLVLFRYAEEKDKLLDLISIREKYIMDYKNYKKQLYEELNKLKGLKFGN